jgi:hypothetical protein
MRTKKEMLQSDLKKLKALSKIIASAQVQSALTRKDYLNMASDGRKNKSKAFQTLKEQRELAKKTIFSSYEKARAIYSQWRWIGVDCVKAGTFFLDQVDGEFNRLMDLN